ncbi:MAG: aspartate/glutamate racemase family protein [Bacteroidota bacterium]
MKTIGLIGGMSWESTLLYYKAINQGVKARLGSLHSAKSIIYSVDFHEVEEKQRLGHWQQLDDMMTDAVLRLERAGADFVVLCTNTMHKCAPAMKAGSRIPLLHIADPTAEELRSRGIKTVGLLGTRFTMEEDFYRNRLSEKFGMSVIIPSPAERAEVHRIIYDELVQGKINPDSKKTYQKIIETLKAQGAEGVILGCTEITLLIQPEDVTLPVLDTTALHAAKAVALALDS